MRIALLSDIHGNTIALDAVLDDIRCAGGVNEYWVVGDLVAIGPDPLGVLDRLVKLDNAYFIRGNTDRYLVTGERPPPTINDVACDLDLLPTVLEITRSFAWTLGAIATTGWLDWLAALPTEQRLILPDGTRLLAVHAAPGTDGGDGIHPALSDDELRTILNGCGADLVCVGHTHWALDRSVEGIRVVNLGSVSNPYPPDLRASYVLLEADKRAYRLEHCRVDYNREAVIALMERMHFSGANYAAKFMQGQHLPRWMSQTRDLG